MGGLPGGDCSDRFCPSALAWVDSPTKDGRTHQYAECANKGYCNRDTGDCECFDGYEGKACGRQSCPANCSGRGTCEYMKELTYGAVYNEFYDGSTTELKRLGTGGKTFPNYNWDAEQSRACVCDGGWTGLGCELRMCPRGFDIMDMIPTFDQFADGGAGTVALAQVQSITLHDQSSVNANFASQTFAIQFTSKLNTVVVTQPIMWSTQDSTLAEYIESALEKLPNEVIDDVTVSVDSSDNAEGVVINITFTGLAVQGEQYPLEILVKPCGDGCTPKLTGLANLRTSADDHTSFVTISSEASFPDYVCGRRGKCDEMTRLCNCFEGFTGDTCNVDFLFSEGMDLYIVLG